MKILEIKNNLVKISYAVSDDLALSGFLVIEDENSPYVGQIVNLNADEEGNCAAVKLLFTFDGEGVVKNYDGTIPSVNASVSKLPANELLDILPVQTPLKIGKLAQQDSFLNVDFSLLERDLVICCSKEDNRNTLLSNFLIQLEAQNKRSIIFDADGLYDNDDKIEFSKDFKLPLNFQTIDYIYDSDLEDVDAVSKAVIQDIFLEVQEYTKTVKDGFIPFDTFINVVDGQYRETNIPQLVLLKNKLLKYKEDNVFAQSLDEIMSLKTAIASKQTTIIDISVSNPKLQREIISHVYDITEGLEEEYYSFVNLTNHNSDKKLLKRFLTEENIYTNIICTHEYKYLPELKQYASNLILFTPETLQHDFPSYNTFLNKLNPDEFVIYGNLTQNIPLIIELDSIMPSSETEAEEETVQNTPMQQPPAPAMTFDELPVAEGFEEPEAEIDEETLVEQVAKDIDDKFIYANNSPEIPPIEENPMEEEILAEPAVEDDLTEDDLDFIDDLNPALQVENIEETIFDEDSSDIEIIEEDTIYEQEPLFEEEPLEINESEITADEFEDKIEETYIEPQEVLPEPEFLEDEEEKTPVVPIYDADEFIPEKEAEQFEQGDSVSHPKYGHGVVEKMIKYGNKTLCSINFENVGRRLLDPAISEITKS